MPSDLEKLVDAMVATGVPYAEAEREFERRFLEAALRASNGSITRCAALTGLHRNTLTRKIDLHGLNGRPKAPPSPSPRPRARARRAAKR